MMPAAGAGRAVPALPAAAGRLDRWRAHDLAALVRRSAMLFATRIGGAAIVYLTQVLLARWMGAEELGVFVVAFSLGLLLTTVATLGYADTALRFIPPAVAQGDAAAVRGWLRRGRQIVAAAAVAVAAIGAAATLGGMVPDRYAAPLLVACLGVPAFAAIRFHAALAHALSRFQLATLPATIARPALFLLGLAVLWRLNGALTATQAMALHLAVLAAVAAVVFVLASRAVDGAAARAAPRADTRLWVRTGLPLLLIALFTEYFPDLAIVLLGLFLPPHAVAVFNAAFRTAFLIAFAIIAIDAAMLPRASRLLAAGDRAALQRLVVRTSQIKLAAAVAGLAVLAAVGHHLLALFGAPFTAGYGALLILAAAQVVAAAAGPGAALLAVSGDQDRCLGVFALGLAATVALVSMLAPRYGIEGAAAAIVAVTATWSVWLNLIVARRVGIRPWAFAAGRRAD